MNTRSTIQGVAITLLALTLVTNTSRAQLGQQQGLLDPNIASETELAALPHMNATLAGKLVAERPFLSMIQLNKVLAESLDIPLRERNRLLEAAGYAHVYRQTPLAAEEMTHMRGVLRFILDKHHDGRNAAG